MPFGKELKKAARKVEKEAERVLDHVDRAIERKETSTERKLSREILDVLLKQYDENKQGIKIEEIEGDNESIKSTLAKHSGNQLSKVIGDQFESKIDPCLKNMRREARNTETILSQVKILRGDISDRPKELDGDIKEDCSRMCAQVKEEQLKFNRAIQEFNENYCRALSYIREVKELLTPLVTMLFSQQVQETQETQETQESQDTKQTLRLRIN